VTPTESNPGAASLELDVETMRQQGYRVVDRVVERIAGLRNDAAWRGASRADLDARLKEDPPSAGQEDLDALLDRLYQEVLPFAARVDHPRFLAFVPGCPTWPGILGDWIASAHNIFQGTWLGSSGPSALELVVLDWFRQWVGYPPESSGLLLTGGSAANLTALAIARAQIAPEDLSRGTVYWCSESHSSMAKAARIVGFTADAVRVLPTDKNGRMSVEALANAVADDKTRGLLPVALIANGGTTSTGAIDPLPELAAFAREQRLWLHVDAAYGGFVVLTERGKQWLRGLEQADSITLDPHKWLYQPFEIGCLMVRDAQRHVRAFQMMAHFLQDTAVAGGEVNFADRGFQLTRSARAIKVWLSIQYFGLDRFRAAIDRSLDLTQYAESCLRARSGFEILSGASLGIVCFRRLWPGADESTLEARNLELTSKLARNGLGLLSSTRVDGRYALRFCILNHTTTRSDVESVIDFLGSA
jgi:glutamate/tyrosine decarboxylase-like PLP-dependent enzyme